MSLVMWVPVIVTDIFFLKKGIKNFPNYEKCCFFFFFFFFFFVVAVLTCLHAFSLSLQNLDLMLLGIVVLGLLVPIILTFIILDPKISSKNAIWLQINIISSYISLCQDFLKKEMQHTKPSWK